jgi:hypothetical protein
MILSLFFLLVAADGLHHPSWLLSLPQTPWPSLQHSDTLDLEPFRYLVRKEMKGLHNEKASDGESVDALEHFFWGESTSHSQRYDAVTKHT